MWQEVRLSRTLSRRATNCGELWRKNSTSQIRCIFEFSFNRIASAIPEPIPHDDDSYYNASLEIGNPCVLFSPSVSASIYCLLIATQSASCQVALACPGGSPFYDPSQSLDAVNKSTSGSLSTIQLAGDTIQGHVFADTIRLGSHSVSGARFLSVSTGFGFGSAPLDGILGLGSLSVTKAPFWQTLMSQVQFDAPQFSLFLNRSNSLSEFAQPAITVQGKPISINNKRVVFDLQEFFLSGLEDDVTAPRSAVPESKLTGARPHVRKAV
ncbi:hypothetical protein B0H19DRAFT_1386585 [Mycena capillaripes]|nr:hypothetical protein B0H19DRAFT_1386585 [Mycena capillaripes]